MTEQAETLFEFPCDFPLKIMGHADADLAQTVLEIVCKHAPDFDGSKMEMRVGKSGVSREQAMPPAKRSSSRLLNPATWEGN